MATADLITGAAAISAEGAAAFGDQGESQVLTPFGNTLATAPGANLPGS